MATAATRAARAQARFITFEMVNSISLFDDKPDRRAQAPRGVSPLDRFHTKESGTDSTPGLRASNHSQLVPGSLQACAATAGQLAGLQAPEGWRFVHRVAIGCVLCIGGIGIYDRSNQGMGVWVTGPSALRG